jgi:hypothetical protein
MTTYTSGDWWIICDVCSKKVKASTSKKRWDGLIVCTDDYESRHPQDYLRAKTDKIAVPFSRPRVEDDFSCDTRQLALVGSAASDWALADISSCADVRFSTEQAVQTSLNQSAVAGFAIAGYSISGRGFPGML